MKQLLMYLICAIVMINLPIFAETKSVGWYQDQLKKYGMKPLDEDEIDAIKSAEKEAHENPNVIINRSIEDFLKEDIKFKQLILGSGPKHQKTSRQQESYYTIDYDKTFFPDIVGSINDPRAMVEIPSNSFDLVIWENIPCTALLNTEAFNQVYRILKNGGQAIMNFPPVCARLVSLLINETEFKGKITPDYGKDLTRPSEWKEIGTPEEVGRSRQWLYFEEKTSNVILEK
jgi:hypothetical protein